LSAKEIAFINEVKALNATVLDDGALGASEEPKAMKARLDDVKRLTGELLTEVARLQKDNEGKEGQVEDLSASISTAVDLRVPSEIRRSKTAMIKSALARETAMLEAASARLERLQNVQ
jgi:nucleoporin NUP82